MDNSKHNVLIVDDDKLLLDIYIIKFKEAGFNVFTALGGEIALGMIREKNYDIILLDIVMPGIDGLELLETIRKENLAKESVIIILSNQGQPASIEKAKLYDIDGYIVKASTIPSEVLNDVREIAKKKLKK